MAQVLDYGQVQQVLVGKGLKCLYHNSGSWGFAGGKTVAAVGWVLGEDMTMTPAARKVARVLGGLEELVAGIGKAWARVGGEAWVLPGSHWAYELDFGTPAMEGVLKRWGVSGVEGLVGRNDGSAVVFGDGEEGAFMGVLGELFRIGTASDYQLIFPAVPITGILHHHVQVWWQTEDTSLAVWLSEAGKSL